MTVRGVGCGDEARVLFRCGQQGFCRNLIYIFKYRVVLTASATQTKALLRPRPAALYGLPASHTGAMLNLHVTVDAGPTCWTTHFTRQEPCELNAIPRSAPPLARWHAQPPAPLLSTPSCDAAQISTMGFNDSAIGRYFKMDERKHITMLKSLAPAFVCDQRHTHISTKPRLARGCEPWRGGLAALCCALCRATSSRGPAHQVAPRRGASHSTTPSRGTDSGHVTG